jgi:hypothetical protein
MAAIPTPDFAVPYAAPKQEKIIADAAPRYPKNGAIYTMMMMMMMMI